MRLLPKTTNKRELFNSLAAVGINHVGEKLHPNNCEGVVEDD